jgi:TRAP-type mannitol/chloroaromatic compound transport system permease small subunit
MARPDLPQTAFSARVEAFLRSLSSIVSWVWLVLLVIIVGNVILRYVFSEGRIEFEEIQWHLYSVGFLLGLGYAVVADAHVRVDVVSVKLAPVTQVWIEFYGIVLALLPFIALVLWFGVPFVYESWAIDEVSQAPGGLPLRWLIKGVLPAAFILLLLAALARLSRVMAYLFGDHE